MSLTLHPVKRATKASSKWCGPSAISILTGLDTRDTARLLRSVGGRRAIKGSYWSEMHSALSKLGFRLDPCRIPLTSVPPKRLTLIAWLKRSRAERGSDTFLFTAGHHFAVVQGRRYACGQSKEIVPFARIPHRCARMEEVYKVVRVADRVVKSAIPVAYKPEASGRAVKRLAEPYGIDVDDSQRDREEPNGTIWVYPGSQWPEGLADPFDDEHYHYDWASARKAVETYIAALVAAKASTAQMEVAS